MSYFKAKMHQIRLSLNLLAGFKASYFKRRKGREREKREKKRGRGEKGTNERQGKAGTEERKREGGKRKRKGREERLNC